MGLWKNNQGLKPRLLRRWIAALKRRSPTVPFHGSLPQLFAIAQKRKPGWFARFLMRRVEMRLHRNLARLALRLPLAGLGPVRSPGKCFLRPVESRISKSFQQIIEDPRSEETDSLASANCGPRGRLT
jgi:hypothetical protein